MPLCSPWIGLGIGPESPALFRPAEHGVLATHTSKAGLGSYLSTLLMEMRLLLPFLVRNLAMSIKIENRHTVCLSNSTSGNLFPKHNSTGIYKEIYFNAVSNMKKTTNQIMPTNSGMDK